MLAQMPARKSILLRNPYTDVLNLAQSELLRRWRETDENQRESLRYPLFISINGIAAACKAPDNLVFQHEVHESAFAATTGSEIFAAL